jgi:hypothetical protein
MDRYVSSVDTSDSDNHSRPNPETESRRNLQQFVTKDGTLKAEILWSIKTVDSNSSFRSNGNVTNVFSQMFQDSAIAKSMSLGATKTMYLSCFGVAPYLRNLLVDKVKNESFIMMFDETLNRELQKKQMDYVLRFWSGPTVQSWYLMSDFMGHGATTNIIDSMVSCVDNTVGFRNLLSVSMDGPNVNHCVFKELDCTMESSYGRKLLNVGSCGLHIMHNAFRAAVKELKVSDVLFALHTLLDDTPARRKDFVRVAYGNDPPVFPLPFCHHRWLENISVCNRAIEMHSPVLKYIKAVESGKLKNPKTKSFEVVQEWVHDPLG